MKQLNKVVKSGKRADAKKKSKARAKQEDKALNLIIKHLSKKLRSDADLDLDEIKTLFLFAIRNDNEVSKQLKLMFGLLEKLAFKRLPAIDKNIEILAYKIKNLENKINK